MQSINNLFQQVRPNSRYGEQEEQQTQTTVNNIITRAAQQTLNPSYTTDYNIKDSTSCGKEMTPLFAA